MVLNHHSEASKSAKRFATSWTLIHYPSLLISDYLCFRVLPWLLIFGNKHIRPVSLFTILFVIDNAFKVIILAKLEYLCFRFFSVFWILAIRCPNFVIRAHSLYYIPLISLCLDWSVNLSCSHSRLLVFMGFWSLILTFWSQTYRHQSRLYRRHDYVLFAKLSTLRDFVFPFVQAIECIRDQRTYPKSTVLTPHYSDLWMIDCWSMIYHIHRGRIIFRGLQLVSKQMTPSDEQIPKYTKLVYIYIYIYIFIYFDEGTDALRVIYLKKTWAPPSRV